MKFPARRFDWLVIDSMVPTGSHTDEVGHHWGDFDLRFHKRWFWFVHPDYWLTFIRANLRSRQ